MDTRTRGHTAGPRAAGSTGRGDHRCKGDEPKARLPYPLPPPLGYTTQNPLNPPPGGRWRHRSVLPRGTHSPTHREVSRELPAPRAPILRPAWSPPRPESHGQCPVVGNSVSQAGHRLGHPARGGACPQRVSQATRGSSPQPRVVALPAVAQHRAETCPRYHFPQTGREQRPATPGKEPVDADTPPGHEKPSSKGSEQSTGDRGFWAPRLWASCPLSQP